MLLLRPLKGSDVRPIAAVAMTFSVLEGHSPLASLFKWDFSYICGALDLDAVWVVSGIGRGMGVLDEVEMVDGEWASFRGKYGASIVTTGDFVA